MSKLITAEQAAELIKDGASVAATGFGVSAWAEEIGQAIEARFVEKGHPQNITLVHSSAIGDHKERGTTRLGKEGLVKRWIGALIGASPALAKLSAENKMEAYCLPQGVIVQLFREIAAKRPGLITKVGLETFVDPRIEGGKMNTVTTENIVKVIKLEGQEWLFYKSFPIDVALIRGTTVDENGNLTMEKEGFLAEALPLAQATNNSGGIVIVQAEYLAKAGSLHPQKVKVPGILVDYIVIATKVECSCQSGGVYFNPAFSGDIRVPLDSIPELPMDERKIIARRAAMELTPRTVVNLGVGIPSDIASVVSEESAADLITLTTESGGVGGVPASLPNFGQVYNVEAIVEHQAQFDYYDGGGLDVAFLGLAQTDKDGNVNVSKFKGRANGPGGFINITQSSKKVVYCGSFTAGGLEVAAEDGKLVIKKEGKNKKFIDTVEQITFSGKYASKVKQPVVYITERAVFKLESGQMVLTEIAPGIDLDKDILALMDFKPVISPDLKTMPVEIFQTKWGQLRTILETKQKG